MVLDTANATANEQAYNAWVASHPKGSLWQSLAWKRYQEALGRETRMFVLRTDDGIQASALVLIDKTTFGLCVWDIPRGPLFSAEVSDEAKQDFMKNIQHEAMKAKCLSVYLSPTSDFSASGSQKSKRHEQPEATIILDLRHTEDELQAAMHPKGRYNIRVAEKHNVTVEESKDVDTWMKLANQTGKRDGFGILPKKNYDTFLKTLPGSFLLIAKRADGTPVAGLIGIVHGTTGYYYYGASSYEDRPLMAPYLLQWEAIKLCKAKGATHYDLLGVAPPDQPNHPWSKISDFKRKFGGDVVLYPAEQQIVLKRVSNILLQWKRKLLR